MHKKNFVLLVLFVLIASALSALPPATPSAGIVERQLEKEYEGKPLEPKREVPSIQIDIPKERLALPEDKKVLIKEVRIQGNESVSTKEIYSWVDCDLNREMSIKEIYELCRRIDEKYAEKGFFLARAYPPVQEIRDGILTIEIIEGKLGKISIEGNKHYSTPFILKYFSSLQGHPLRYNDFLRSLMLLNENSDLAAGAVFERGEAFGTADVILRVDDGRPLHLYLNGNNYGRFLTTNARVGGRFDGGSLFFYGDKISVAQVVGFPIEALFFTDVSYTVPLNAKGTFLECSYLFSKFKVEELKFLDLRGRSDIATLKVSHAIMRRLFWSVDFFSYFDFKQIGNFVLHSTASYDKLRVLTAGFLFDHYGLAKGRDYLNFRMSYGIPHFLGGLRSVDSGCSRNGAGGLFLKMNADYDRIQQLPRNCYLYLHGSGQWSPYKLTLPEVIYIGGIDTVRGFPLASALGDSGYYVNMELRIPPPFLANKRFFMAKKSWKEIVQIAGFVDHGGVFLQSEKSTFEWGSGVGLRVNGPYSLTFSLDVGFPLNHRDSSKSPFVYIKLTGQPF